ncbi:hypothetical protein HY640_03245 [Candidatus Woesearchaeota archaeon]|nr:hypothetical protein [Candidatus Woesearchaeota archaeon]
MGVEELVASAISSIECRMFVDAWEDLSAARKLFGDSPPECYSEAIVIAHRKIGELMDRLVSAYRQRNFSNAISLLEEYNLASMYFRVENPRGFKSMVSGIRYGVLDEMVSIFYTSGDPAAKCLLANEITFQSSRHGLILPGSFYADRIAAVAALTRAKLEEPNLSGSASPSFEQLTKGYSLGEHFVYFAGKIHANEGWKLHIGAFPETALGVYEVILPPLQNAGIEHKVLRLGLVGAYNNSSQAGKAITIYPCNSAEAVEIARFADSVLRANNLSGPPAINETKFGNLGIAYRYSCFGGKQVKGPNGERVSDSYLRKNNEVPPWIGYDPFTGLPNDRPAAYHERRIRTVKAKK